MNRVEQSNMIQTIVKGYMADINNPKTLAEIQDILRNHFYTVATSECGINKNYFAEEYQFWSNK
jgi:hypothetical protein